MFEEIKEELVKLLSSRLFVLFAGLFLMAAILIYRIFQLQIVNGSEYMENFTLSIEKEVVLPGARGNIYDRNGKLLAYNELAYSVTMTDTIASGKGKNQQLNDIIYRMIQMIESNGDELSCDFDIYLDENDNYCFSVSDTALLRFLADVYGYSSVNDLKYVERTANPDTVMDYLISSSKYGVGCYFDSDDSNSFVPGMGFTKEEILKIVAVRYNLGLNAFQKYISTTIATDVSPQTVAMIMENSSELDGVTIEQGTVRRYNYALCMSPVIGYTGKISQTEYDTYSLESDNYSLNDTVGKAGIELSMESYLQGTKGAQTICVDNLGKVIETLSYEEPVAGNDIYLTIDVDLQNVVYHLVEQKIAGILVSKIQNLKTVENQGRDVIIPIYDVYFALFNNNVIDINRFSKSYAGDVEKEVYNQYLTKQGEVLNQLRDELLYGDTSYKNLSDEFMVYESFIVSMLSSSNYGILLIDKIDPNDETYIAWKTEETISISEFLHYAIAQEWIDISKLELEEKYADSNEIYEALVDYTIEHLRSNRDFSKKLYRYMLLQDYISPRQVCQLLWEQDIIQLSPGDAAQLESGNITPYYFMLRLISELQITPAQLGLEPCSGSCVVTDVNNGQVLAMVSYPGYDNNNLDLASLSQDQSNPLWNYATQQRTAPGSTFKVVTAVAGIEENVVTIGETITCTGIFDRLNGTVHKCWIAPGSHGDMIMNTAIAKSCNVYFYELGYRLAYDGNSYNDTYGISRIAKYADWFGFSEKSGVEIAESEPKISDQYPVVSAIGQGTHSFTTVQLARYVTAVANSGTVYQLSLIDSIKDSRGVSVYEYTPTVRNTIELPDELWNTIHYGMRQVVQSKSYFADLPLAAAGKTGTAQEATNRANHALFVGYAPYDNPQIAIATRIANGYSSENSAQLSRDVFAYYFQLEEEDSLITGEASEAVGTVGGD